jgi:F-type H+-transporting ATPase subunit epsilon
MAFMNLKILLPFRVFAQVADISRIIIDTYDGSFGFLPNRIDCVSALIPGIFIYEVESKGPSYIAIDAGILVKAGMQVLLSVRNAVGGADLGELGALVKKEFKQENEGEAKVSEVMAKLESGFLYRFDKIRND